MAVGETRASPATCRFWWGSHGCSLPDAPHTTHRCGGSDDLSAHWESAEWPCSEFDELTGLVRLAIIPDDEDGVGHWSAWRDGWTGQR